MTPQIAIAGLGLVGAFGTGLENFRNALSRGQCEPEFLPVDPDGDKVTCPVLRARTDNIDTYVGVRQLRRIDHFSRLAILGVGTALTDADMIKADRSRMGVVVGTGYGATTTTFDFMDSMIDFGDACASPTKFSNSVHNAAAANVAITLKMEGVNLTISQFEMSIPMALIAAVHWLQTEVADTILVGGVDEYCKQLGYCYKRYFGIQTETMSPFDFDHQSAIPGEGAAFLVLKRLQDAQNPRATIDAIDIGHGPCILPTDGPVVIGADGHKQSGQYYKAADINRSNAICFSEVYGSLPSSPAFEMAAALVELEKGAPKASCLKYNCSGAYGLISLSNAGI